MRYESRSVLGCTVVDVNPGGIDVEAKNKTVHYDFSDYLGTKVVRNYYNGIYAGKTRYMSFHDESVKLGKTRMLNFSSKEKDDFMRIAADIDKTCFDISDKPEELVHHFDEARTFDAGRVSVKKNSLKHILLLTLLPLVIITAALITGLIIKKTGDESLGHTVTWLSAAAYIVAAVLVIPEVSYVIRGLKNIPSRVIIDQYSVRVDDNLFARESIGNVKLTPPSYQKWERRMTVKDRNGNHVYSFGSSAGNPQKTSSRSMPEYEEFYNALRLWCHLNNVTFFSDLG